MNLDCLAHDVVGRRLLSLGLLLGCVAPAFAQVTAVKYRSVDLDCDRIQATGSSLISVQSGPGLAVSVFGSLNTTPAGTLPYYSLGIGPIGLDPNTLFTLSPFFALTDAFGRTQASFPTAGFTVGTQIRFQAAVVDPLAPVSFALSDTVVRTVQAGPTTAYQAGPSVSGTVGTPTTRNVATGDIDGDGDEDVYVCGLNASDELYLANGVGGLVLAPGLNLPFGSNDAEFVDLNNDNLLDLVCVSGQGLTILVNNFTGGVVGGTPGVTQSGPILTAPGAQPSFNAVDTGDVDNDGDIDILVGASSGTLGGAQNRLWLNLFSAGAPFAFQDSIFSATAGLPTPLIDNTEDVEFADVDGDGDLDAFIANFFCYLAPPPNPVISTVGWQDYLLLNNGSGLFTTLLGPTGFPIQTLPPALPGAVSFDNSIDCEFGDVDGDGDLDLAVGNWQVAAGLAAPFPGISYEANRIYTNNGLGAFTLSVGALQSFAMPTNDLEFLDYDRDGDLDLIEINGNFQTAAPVGAPGVRNLLLRNNGAGSFVVDTTVGAAILAGPSNAIGVEVADLWPNRHAVDIVIATVNGGVITFQLQ